ncbi:MAG: hypothetical protein A2583_05015 [Bdellovibrionales bacterium RIFOXYD1_FULL_53_11]|nr:MAG: hypothetical protein A2583_05015 [Bdellovibrionales bacterium RIFOXYD1_FULL_53_11]
MDKAILLTGGTGFLGANILKRLLKDGRRVVLLKRVKSDLRRIRGQVPALRVYDADAGGLEVIFKENRIDTIIHCATNYGRGNVPPPEIIDANLTLPLRLLQAAKENGTRLFINSDTILDKQVSHYSLSKKQFLDWLAHFAGDMVCANVALEHFYGPDDDPSKFVTRVVQELVREVPSMDFTPGRQKRDFIFIDDVVDAYMHILRSGLEAPRGLYRFEVGSRTVIEIRQFVELVKELSGNKNTVLNFGALPYRANEVMESRTDTAALDRLGWAPRVDLKQGLETTIAGERIKPGAGLLEGK